MVILKNNQLLLECDCLTHWLKLSKDEDNYYIEFLESSFYSKQKQTLCKRLLYKIKYIWYIIIGKEYRLESFVLSKEDYEELEKSIQMLKYMKSEK